MLIIHEGSCLFIHREGKRGFVLAEDVDLTEACEIMLDSAKAMEQHRKTGNLIVSPVIRKVAYPRTVSPMRRQSSTGWPKV